MGNFCVNVKGQPFKQLTEQFDVAPFDLELSIKEWMDNNNKDWNKQNTNEVVEYLNNKYKINQTFQPDIQALPFEEFAKIHRILGTLENASFEDADKRYVALCNVFGKNNVAKYQDKVGNWVVRAAEPALNGYTSEMQQIKEKAIKDGTFMKAPNGKPTNLNERQWLQVRTKAFKDWFGDWTKITFDKDGKVLTIPDDCSKVVDENGEPLVVYHGSKDSWTIYDKNRFKKDQFGRGIYLSEDYNNSASYGKVRAFFVNARHPFYAGHIWDDNGNRNIRVSVAGLLFNNETIGKDNYIKELKRYVNENDAAVIGKELSESDAVVVSYKGSSSEPAYKYGEIVVSNPNQIKSATDNVGTFSTENDDIRYNRDANRLFDLLDFISKNKKFTSIDDNEKHKIISKLYGRFYLTKFTGSEKELENFRIANLLPKDIFILKEHNNSIEVVLNEEILNDFIERNTKNANFGDLFSSQEEANAVEDVLKFLSAKTGLKYETVSFEEAKKINKNITKNTNAFVSNSTCYFIEGRRLNVDIASEEMLHPFIAAMRIQNPQLFYNLAKESIKLFPKLRFEINEAYKDRPNSEQTEELVTQALSRAFRVELETHPERRKVTRLIENFVRWVRELFTTGEKDYILTDEIKADTTLVDLAKILNTELQLVYNSSYNNIVRENSEKKQLLTESKIKEKGYFKRNDAKIQYNFTSNLQNSKGTKVAARRTTDASGNNTINLDIDFLKQKYDEKAWNKPYLQPDNSIAEPLSENTFNSFDEFLTFVILHEYYHTQRKINEGETRGEYETAINNLALQDLKNNYISDTTQQTNLPGPETKVSVTESTGGYQQRTRENADWSDITLALAVDFSTYGERATKKAAGSKYVSSPINPRVSLDDLAEGAAVDILEQLYDKGKTKNLKLNIAGNGIYTLSKNYTQEQINDLVYKVLRKILSNGITISEIRSGGQTGVDEAGIIAAQKLGIPASVHAPKGFAFRDANGKDRYNREEFVARFQQQPAQQPVTQETNPVVTEQQRQAEEIAQEKEAAIEEAQNLAAVVLSEDTDVKPQINKVTESKLAIELKDIRGAENFPVEERLHLAKVFADCLSTIIDSIVDDGVVAISEMLDFPEKFKNLKFDENTDFSKMTRQEIIQTVGFDNLVLYVKEMYFNLDGFFGEDDNMITGIVTDDATKQANIRLMYDNFNAFLMYANREILQLESYSVDSKEFVIDVDDQTRPDEQTDVTGQAEEIGETEAYQIRARSISGKNSLSAEIRRFMRKLTVKDKNDKSVDKYGYGYVQRVDSDVAVNAIFAWCCNDLTSEQMLRTLKEKAQTIPWVQAVVEKLENDKKFRSKFYHNFRKDQTKLSVIISQWNKEKKRFEYAYKNINFKSFSKTAKETLKSLVYGNQIPFLETNVGDNADGALQTTVNEKKVEALKASVTKATEVINNYNTYKNENPDETGDLIGLLDNLVENVKEIYKGLGFTEEMLNDDIWSQLSIAELKSLKSNANTAISALVKGNTTVSDFMNWKSMDDSLKILEEHAPEIIEPSSFEAGKTYYTYTNPSYMGTLAVKIRDANNDGKFQEVLDEFKQSRFYCESDPLEGDTWYSYWLGRMVQDPKIREYFDHKVQIAFNKTPYTKMSAAEYTASCILEYAMHPKMGDYNMAWYVMPIFADKPSSEFLRFEKFVGDGYKDTIVSHLKNTFLQECIRIKTTLEKAKRDDVPLIDFCDLSIEQKTDKEHEKFMNELRSGNLSYETFCDNIDWLKSTGASFRFLDFMNDAFVKGNEFGEMVFRKIMTGMLNEADLDEKLGKYIRFNMEQIVANEINTFRSQGLFKFKRTKKSTDSVFLPNLVGDKFQFYKDKHAKGVAKLEEKHFDAIEKDMEASIVKQVENYCWNKYLATINIIELTVGDLAYFPNSLTFQKRYSMVHSPGLRLDTLAVDPVTGKPVSDGKSRTIILTDNVIQSELKDSVDAIFENFIDKLPSEDKEMYRNVKTNILKQMDEVNVADAQAYSCPTSYRKKMIMTGDWTDAMENVYQNMLNGTVTIEEISAICQPLKPLVSTNMNKRTGIENVAGTMVTQRVPMMNKNSEYMLFIADALTRTGKDSNKLTAIFDFMENTHWHGRKVVRNGRVYVNGIYNEEETKNNKTGIKDGILDKGVYQDNGIDTIQFESAVKVGGVSKVDLNGDLSYDEMMSRLNFAAFGKNYATGTERYNTMYTETFSFEDYMIQQEVPAHLMDHEQSYGSQMRILGVSDLNNEYLIGLRNEYFNLIAENIYESFEQLKTDFLLTDDALVNQVSKLLKRSKDKQAFNSNVDEVFAKLPLDRRNEIKSKYSEDLKDASEMNLLPITPAEQNYVLSELLQDAVKRDAKFSSDLIEACLVDSEGNFRVPVNDPIQSVRIQQLLNSIVKSRINKQKMAGGPVVQVSAFGFSNQVKVVFSDKNGNEITKSRNDFKSDEEYQKFLKNNIKSIKHFECYMTPPTAALQKKLEKYDENGNYIGMMSVDEALEKGIINEEQLKAIGYRIPTEDKYSMVPLKIVGFLPRFAGEGVVLPPEITLLSGSDFDIDKLYIMLRESQKSYVTRKLRIREVEEAFAKHLKETKFKDSKENTLSNIKRYMSGKNDVRLPFREVMNRILKGYRFDTDVAENEWGLEIYDWFHENILNDDKYWKEVTGTTKTDRNNRIFDIQYEILQSEDVADKVFNPGGFGRLKKVASEIRTAKHVNQDNLSILNQSTQTYFHAQNMAAKDLIGIMANANTSHAFINMQDITLELNERVSKLMLNGVNMDHAKLDPLKSFDGRFVSKILASGVSASVDAVKDPVFKTMNISTTTADVATLLWRLGMDEEFVGYFMAQPVLVDLVEKYEVESSAGYASFTKMLNDEIAARKISVTDVMKSYNFTTEDFHRTLNANPNDKSQNKILALYSVLSEIADDLNEITFMTKFNSVSNATGPNISNNMEKWTRVEEYCKRAGTQAGREDTWFSYQSGSVIKNNPILKAFYSTTIGEAGDFWSRQTEDGAAKQLFDRYFIQYSNAFKTYLNKYMRCSTSRMDADLIDRLANFMMLYCYNSTILSPNAVFDMSEANRKYLAGNKFMKDVMAAKVKHPSNELLKRINVKEPSKKCKYRTLETKISGMSADMLEKIQGAWEELFRTEPELAKNLFQYCTFRSGLTFSPKTWLHVADSYTKNAMSGYVELTRQLANADESVMDFNDIIKQFKLNNYDDTAVVPFVSEDDMKATLIKDHIVLTGDMKNVRKLIADMQVEDSVQIIPVSIVRFKNQLYEIRNAFMAGKSTVSFECYPVKPLGIPNNYIECGSGVNSTVFDGELNTDDGEEEPAIQTPNDEKAAPVQSSYTYKNLSNEEYLWIRTNANTVYGEHADEWQIFMDNVVKSKDEQNIGLQLYKALERIKQDTETKNPSFAEESKRLQNKIKLC